jgi:hypothetical protein
MSEMQPRKTACDSAKSSCPRLTRFKCPLSRLAAIMVEVLRMSLKEADQYAVIQQVV